MTFAHVKLKNFKKEDKSAFLEEDDDDDSEIKQEPLEQLPAAAFHHYAGDGEQQHSPQGFFRPPVSY